MIINPNPNAASQLPAALAHAASASQASAPSTPMSLRDSTSNNQKSVTFSQNNRFLIIKSHLDFNQDERDAVWPTTEEVRANHCECVESVRAIIRMRRQGISVAEDLLCARGLQMVVCGSAARRCAQQRRMNLLNDVFWAQEMAKTMVWTDADANAKILQAISQVYSEEDTAKAWAMGQSDAACVRRILRREERSTTKMVWADADANAKILQAVSQVYSEEDTVKAWAMGQSDAACVRRIRRREER